MFEEKVLKNKKRYNWKEYKLSDISRMINGYSYKGYELTDKSNIGMATIKNFERNGGFKLDGFKSIIPNKNVVDSLFLYYLLAYYRPVIENLGSGTTFKEVSGSVMKNLVVNIPEVEEQKKIAAILSSLDDKIELNRRINDNLTQAA